MSAATMGIGMGTNFIGSQMQGIAASMAAQQMAKTYQDYINKMRVRRNEALGALIPNITGSGREAYGGAMATGKAQRLASYKDLAASPATFGPPMPARDQAYGELIAGPRAQLGSYGDAAFNQGLLNQLTARKMGQAINFAQGEMATMPYSMYEAGHKFDWLSMLGQMIAAAGGNSTNIGQIFGPPPTTPQQRYGSLINPSNPTGGADSIPTGFGMDPGLA